MESSDDSELGNSNVDEMDCDKFSSHIKIELKSSTHRKFRARSSSLPAVDTSLTRNAVFFSNRQETINPKRYERTLSDKKEIREETRFPAIDNSKGRSVSMPECCLQNRATENQDCLMFPRLTETCLGNKQGEVDSFKFSKLDTKLQQFSPDSTSYLTTKSNRKIYLPKLPSSKTEIIRKSSSEFVFHN